METEALFRRARGRGLEEGAGRPRTQTGHAGRRLGAQGTQAGDCSGADWRRPKAGAGSLTLGKGSDWGRKRFGARVGRGVQKSMGIQGRSVFRPMDSPAAAGAPVAPCLSPRRVETASGTAVEAHSARPYSIQTALQQPED